MFAFCDAPFLGREQGTGTSGAGALVTGPGGYAVVNKDQSFQDFVSLMILCAGGAAHLTIGGLPSPVVVVAGSVVITGQTLACAA